MTCSEERKFSLRHAVLDYVDDSERLVGSFETGLEGVAVVLSTMTSEVDPSVCLHGDEDVLPSSLGTVQTCDSFGLDRSDVLDFFVKLH
jgi:hypothetical protein